MKAMSAHLFARILATGDGDPLQKTIVFCASDHHADLITNELNGLYSAWARTNAQKRIQNYAFKCMSSVNGQALIPDFRGRAYSGSSMSGPTIAPGRLSRAGEHVLRLVLSAAAAAFIWIAMDYLVSFQHHAATPMRLPQQGRAAQVDQRIGAGVEVQDLLAREPVVDVVDRVPIGPTPGKSVPRYPRNSAHGIPAAPAS